MRFILAALVALFASVVPVSSFGYNDHGYASDGQSDSGCTASPYPKSCHLVDDLGLSVGKEVLERNSSFLKNSGGNC